MGVEIALECGSSWGATDQARYDAWAKNKNPVKDQVTSNSFKASGVPDGLDPVGVKIALEGGSSWGATDQARYDAWAQNKNPIQDQITGNSFSASGVPDGLDPVGVKITLEGGSSWRATDQARYDA